MSLINWIFDFEQHERISRAREDASRARAKLAELQRGTEGTQAGLEQLALSVKTLRRMLIEKGVCTDAELRAMLAAVDRQDGREDGRAPLG